MVIGWIPFLEPLNAAQTWWYVLIIPMAIGISMMYRAIRDTSYAHYWRSVLITSIQIVGCIALIAIGVGLWVQLVIPFLNSP